MTPRAVEPIETYWTVGADCHEQKHRFVMLDERCGRQDALWVTNKVEDIQEALTLRAVDECRDQA